MANVAKLVWATVATRVVVDENATDEQIWDQAKYKLGEILASTDGMDYLESIQDDKELPYGTLDGEN